MGGLGGPNCDILVISIVNALTLLRLKAPLDVGVIGLYRSMGSVVHEPRLGFALL